LSGAFLALAAAAIRARAFARRNTARLRFFWNLALSPFRSDMSHTVASPRCGDERSFRNARYYPDNPALTHLHAGGQPDPHLPAAPRVTPPVVFLPSIAIFTDRGGPRDMWPILFHLPFGLPLYAYGTFLCLSVVIGRITAVRLARSAGLDPALMDCACVWALVGALVGTRLLYVVTNLEQFSRPIDVFLIGKGGLVAYGAFLGGFVSTLVFCRIHRINLWVWVDCVAPSLCIGLLLTRVGCFLAGCDYGKPWDGPWAVHFPAGSLAVQEQTLQGLLPPGATQSLAVHPTQLYVSLAGLALLVLVTVVRRRRSFSGQVFLTLVPVYAVLRYVIEVFRADLYRGALGPFSTSQVIAMVTFLSAVMLSYALRPRPSQSLHSKPEWTL
jgi:prolipoprotein diacylglyceryl transferase